MDTPELSFEELAAEAITGLWTLRQAMPLRPEGQEDAYQPPARFYLPKLAAALACLSEAAEQAKAEIPARLQKEALQYFRRFGPSWAELTTEPEVRRFFQVSIAKEMIEGLIDDLANEGRPQAEPNLKLGKVRR